MYIKRMGIDLAKQVFQLHGVDRLDKACERKTLNRAQMQSYFKEIPPTLIGMEACSSSHYWGRVLSAYGHTVKLIAPQFVKPYVKSGKNDANDAEAICEAVGRPNMRFVSIKSADRETSILFDNEPEPDSPDGDRFEILITLIEWYETKYFPVDLPDPLEAIKFRMEQQGLTPKDLVPMIGKLNRVYEVLSRKRPLTLPMIRRLHESLGIPAESLIKPPNKVRLAA